MFRAVNKILGIFVFFLCLDGAFASPPDCLKFITADDAQFADKYMQLFREGKLDQILAVSDAKIKSQLPPAMDEFKKIFTTVESLDRVMFGCNVTTFSPFNSSSKSKVFALSYEWSGKDVWYAANLRWTERDNQRIVDVLHIDPLPAPLEKIHAFTLSGKGMSHWIFSIVAVFDLLFIFYALIICARTKIPKLKWLWILFITIGVCKINLNWTTGEVFGLGENAISGLIKSLPSIQIFTASYARASEYAPIIMSVSIPIGAILFFIRKRKWQTSSGPEVLPVKN